MASISNIASSHEKMAHQAEKSEGNHITIPDNDVTLPPSLTAEDNVSTAVSEGSRLASSLAVVTGSLLYCSACSDMFSRPASQYAMLSA
jgi:hypothetical protein